MTDEMLLHWCEVCAREQSLTSEEGFRLGWDFPPRMGVFGAVSPRTCPGCPIDQTVWWAVAVEKTPARELSEKQRRALTRIHAEFPEDQNRKRD